VQGIKTHESIQASIVPIRLIVAPRNLFALGVHAILIRVVVLGRIDVVIKSDTIYYTRQVSDLMLPAVEIQVCHITYATRLIVYPMPGPFLLNPSKTTGVGVVMNDELTEVRDAFLGEVGEMRGG